MRKLLVNLMTDEQISRLTLPELIELLQRISEEIEIRVMKLT